MGRTRAIWLAAPDLILASGCVYGVADDVWAALVRTLAELAGPATVILLAHGNGAAPGVQQMRGRFYELLARERFAVARVEPRALHADHRRGRAALCDAAVRVLDDFIVRIEPTNGRGRLVRSPRAFVCSITSPTLRLISGAARSLSFRAALASSIASGAVQACGSEAGCVFVPSQPMDAFLL